MKKQYENRAKDHQTFFTELESEHKTMKIVADYYGVGLFNNIHTELERYEE